MTKTCTICKREFECTNEKFLVCYSCIMDGSYQRTIDKERDEQEQNRKDYLAFRTNECDDDTNPDLYQDEEAREVYYDAEDERLWQEAFDQELAEKEDNKSPSGSTDLGNRGGTTFNH